MKQSHSSGEKTGNPPSITIRPEGPGDEESIRSINNLAFGGRGEGGLVDEMRREGVEVLSLVACEVATGTVVGHILFSPMKIDPQLEGLQVAALGPVAVLPERQREGIGSMMIQEGLERCRQRGYGIVVLLGDPVYYSRFGFSPASAYGIRSEFEVNPIYFQMLKIDETEHLLPDGHEYLVRYHPAFHRLEE